jgi:dTDP-4-amino-4,6-dideoxygalactose transaminase
VIAFSNPREGFLRQKPALYAALTRVLAGGRYILGEEVSHLEAEFARFSGAQHCVGVSNGTEGICLVLMALGIGPGDEVITVSHTATATATGILQAGATPVLVDIEPSTYTMDPDRVFRALSRRTKAIMPVHLYGHPAEMSALAAFCRRHGLLLLEDCSQAHGSVYQGRPVGTFGTAGIFSCYPTKNLGAMGDAGLVICGSTSLARKLRELRQYGWRGYNSSQAFGINARLDELQAAFLRVKLRTLRADNRRRRWLASRYIAGLRTTGMVLPKERPGCHHVFHLFVVRGKRRRRVMESLARSGVLCGIHYRKAIHQQKGFQGRIRVSGSLAQTESACRGIMSLPMYPELSPAHQNRVIRLLQTAASVS